MLVYQEEMEGLSLLAQQVLDETHISSQISSRATKITARYHVLLLHLLVRQIFSVNLYFDRYLSRCQTF